MSIRSEVIICSSFLIVTIFFFFSPLDLCSLVKFVGLLKEPAYGLVNVLYDCSLYFIDLSLSFDFLWTYFLLFLLLKFKLSLILDLFSF